MKPSSGLANAVIDQILELSADAHIERRLMGENSPGFHRLTGAIAAYGKALTLLFALRKREEFFAVIAHVNLPPSASQYQLFR
jgi:hypothetical protein